MVGYTSVDVKAGKWYLISTPFQTVGNTVANKTVKLQEFIQGGLVGNTLAGNCPRLQVWNAEEDVYTDYYFYSSSSGTGDKYYNFWSSNGRSRSNAEAAMDITLDLGIGAWLNPKNDCTITVAGQVCEVSETTIDVVGNKWNLIANPFPVALKLNKNVNWAEAGLVGNTLAGNCPRIQVWDSESDTYTDYYFYSSSSGTGDKYYNFWSSNGRSRSNAEAAMENAVVPVGQGFWFQNLSDDLTLTFTK